MSQRKYEGNCWARAQSAHLAAGCLAVLFSAGCADGYEHRPESARHEMAPGSAMVGELMIESAWARASNIENRPSAAYLTVTNKGKKADRIVAVESVAAGKAVIHEIGHKDGVMRMRPVDGVDVPPGTSVTLAPGGTHIMLMKLDHMLMEGETIPVTVRFEHAGSATVAVPVKKGGMGHGKMKHGGEMKHEGEMKHGN